MISKWTPSPAGVWDRVDQRCGDGSGCVIGTFSQRGHSPSAYLSVGQGEERRGPGEEEATTQIAVRLGAAAASLDVRHCKGKGTGLLSEVKDEGPSTSGF